MEGYCINRSTGYFSNVATNQWSGFRHVVWVPPMVWQCCLGNKWCQSIAGRRVLTGDGSTFVSTYIYYDKSVWTNDRPVLNNVNQWHWLSSQSPYISYHRVVSLIAVMNETCQSHWQDSMLHVSLILYKLLKIFHLTYIDIYSNFNGKLSKWKSLLKDTIWRSI